MVIINESNYLARPLNPPQGDFYGMVPSWGNRQGGGVKITNEKEFISQDKINFS
jgi:hypothetical protein